MGRDHVGRARASRDATQPRVRLDDLRANRSTTFDGFERELRAMCLSDVRDVLRAADDAAASGRWVVGYVAYEAAPAFDRGLRVVDAPGAGPHLPLAWFGVYRESRVAPLRLPGRARGSANQAWTVATTREDYTLRVKTILDEIAVGNAYQVNLTSPVLSDGGGDHVDLYRRLLLAQCPAYGALLEFDGVAVLSASPELFFDFGGGCLTSRPMKGTARRGRWAQEDSALAAGLAASAKDRAENTMIVDLIRNDLGKIAVTGGVEVTALCEIEGYPHVWQMVSEVRAATRPGVGVLDVFAAMFPCGSVTGAPKQSAMSIIADLEDHPRGVYCGAVGVIGPGASGVRARFNVAIRTAVVDLAAGSAVFGSGGGIVADSSPEAEHAELVLKADMLDSPVSGSYRLVETFGHDPAAPSENRARHLDRMRASARVLGFRVPDDLSARVDDALASVGRRVRARVLLARSGRLDIQVGDAPVPTSAPVRLAVDDEPVDSHATLAFHKTTRREAHRRALRRHGDADDVIRVNERGECTEVTIANLAARFGDRWVTPPVSSGCLPGVERGRLVELGVLLESTFTPDDLLRANELAVVNSLRGWRRAILVDPPGVRAGDQ